jgi:hypothetical protein
MEPEGSSPLLQEPSTCPYPEPDQANSYHPILCLQDPLRITGISGLCPSSWIVNTRKHNVSETGSVFVLRWEEGDTTLLGPLERANLNH